MSALIEVVRGHKVFRAPDVAPHFDGSLVLEVVFEVGKLQQNALAWHLRASMSLGKLWSQQDRKSNAFALLNGVYRRFSEGFQTKDMCDARALRDRFA